MTRIKAAWSETRRLALRVGDRVCRAEPNSGDIPCVERGTVTELLETLVEVEWDARGHAIVSPDLLGLLAVPQPVEAP